MTANQTLTVAYKNKEEDQDEETNEATSLLDKSLSPSGHHHVRNRSSTMSCEHLDPILDNLHEAVDLHRSISSSSIAKPFSDTIRADTLRKEYKVALGYHFHEANNDEDFKVLQKIYPYCRIKMRYKM